MIPFVDVPAVQFIGFRLEPFDLLLGLAFIVGYQLAKRRAKGEGLDATLTGEALFIGIVSGLVGAHLVSILFYFPERLRADPWVLFRVWDGLSSYGAMLGGLAGLVLFLKVKREPVLPHLDALCFGAVPAWAIGRVGCAIVHDHPGVASNFFLAVRYPVGSVCNAGQGASGCHDMGLYEVLFLGALSILLYAIRNRRPFRGFHACLCLFLYAPGRFLLDSLRVVDARYLGLTPGQYISLSLMLASSALLMRGFASKTTE